MATYLADLSTRCDLREVRFDRWLINDLERALERIGTKVPLTPHGQGYKDMSPAIDQFEALALNGRLRHGNHPIMSWCAANAVITKDPAGNRKIDKSRATGRVDGLVAAVMAVAAMTGGRSRQSRPTKCCLCEVMMQLQSPSTKAARLYGSEARRCRAKRQLELEPLCRVCLAQGRIRWRVWLITCGITRVIFASLAGRTSVSLYLPPQLENRID